MPATEKTEDVGWAVVEVFGHRKLVGYVSEQEIAGAAFLRIDTPQDPPITEFYAPSAIYGISPTTEAMVRGIIAQGRKRRPVERWELPPGPAPAVADAEAFEESVDEADIPY